MPNWRVRFGCFNCLETKEVFEKPSKMHHRWFYSAEGYTLDMLPGPPFSDSLDCFNPDLVFRNITAVYRVGPADTSTPAISFLHNGPVFTYEKTSEAHLGESAAGLPINYVCTTGSTEWMIFSEQNFKGTYKCFGSSTRQVHCAKGETIGLQTMGSVIRGCIPIAN